MKAALYHQPGEPDVLRYEEVSDPVPGPGDVLLHVQAISIEGGDLLSRRWMPPRLPPTVPGYAAAGTVLALGEDVAGFAVGDRVTSFGFEGAYAEQRAVAAANCWRVPEGLDMARAAATPVAFGTAALALDLGRIAKGDTVLVQGVTGGVGIAVIQLARLAGARVIGTSRSAAALDELRRFGLDDAVVSVGVPVADQVRELLRGAGADLLIDNIGGDAFREGLRALREGGRAVIVGIAGPGNKSIEASELLSRRLSVFGCFLGPIMGQPMQRSMIAKLLEQLATGVLDVPIDAVFPLKEAAAAHARAEMPGRLGRVIMTP